MVFVRLLAVLAAVAGLAVSDRGGKFGFVYKSRQRAYKALRRKGLPKSMAAAIANGGRFHPQRSRMARKAARTRRLRYGRSGRRR